MRKECRGIESADAEDRATNRSARADHGSQQRRLFRFIGGSDHPLYRSAARLNQVIDKDALNLFDPSQVMIISMEALGVVIDGIRPA